MRRFFDVATGHTDLGNIPALPAIYPKYEAPIVIANQGHRSLFRSQWSFLTPNTLKKTSNWLKLNAWNNSRDDKIRTAPL